METKEIIGRNIRSLRSKQGMSLSALAREIGVDNAYMGRLERGEKNPRSDTLLRIAYALNVTVDNLFNFDIGGLELQSSTVRRLLELSETLDQMEYSDRSKVLQIIEQVVKLKTNK